MTRKKIRSRQANPPADSFGVPAPTDAGHLPLGQPPASREFNPDYTYVVKDLRRIVVLAGSLIVILIGLSLFLK